MQPAASQPEPKVVTLQFGGHDLRITYGALVKAEEQDARKRWVRIWPRGRLLEPAPDLGCRSKPDWDLPSGQTWGDIFANVPAELLSVAARFSMQQWSALEFAQNGSAFRDLLHSNPVLAYALACNDEFRSTTKEEAAKRAASRAALKQREIAKCLGFPDTESTVRLFKQLIPESADPSSLRLLRGAMPFEARLSKLISHLDIINAGVLAFLVQAPLRDLVTPGLLSELTAAAEEMDQAPSADMVLDTVRMGNEIRGWTMPPLLSRARIKEVHDRVLLEHLAEQARIRRAIEAQKEQERLHQLERQREADRRARRSRLPFPEPPIPGNEYIVPIVSEPELIIEGLDQRNCVASYVDRVRDGHAYFYRVLNPERATLLIVRGRKGTWMPSEVKRKANGAVGPRTITAVQVWIAEEGSKRRRIWDDTPF